MHETWPCVVATTRTKNGPPLTDYCQTDVDALADLLPRLLPRVNRIDQALHRGRYLKAVSRMETAGIPVDIGSFHAMRERLGRNCETALVTETAAPLRRV